MLLILTNPNFLILLSLFFFFFFFIYVFFVLEERGIKGAKNTYLPLFLIMVGYRGQTEGILGG